MVPLSGEELVTHGENVKSLYVLLTKGMCLEAVDIICLILIHDISFLQQIVKILYKTNLSVKLYRGDSSYIQLLMILASVLLTLF